MTGQAAERQSGPRYFFNLRNGTGYIEDEEGRELPDLETVRDEAIKGVRSLVADDALHGRIDLKGSLEVLDDDGRLVLTVLFAEAVEVSR
jgi:hypothetical protein